MGISTNDLKNLSKDQQVRLVNAADIKVDADLIQSDSSLQNSAVNERLHKLTLQFRNYTLEAAYNRQYAEWMRRQAGLAYVLGILVVLMHFYVDYTAPGITTSTTHILWSWRIQIAIIGLIVLCLIPTQLFLNHHQGIVTLTSLYSGSCLIAMFQYVPETTAYIYFGGLIPLFHWSLFAGLRFIYLLICSISSLVAFNATMIFIVGHSMTSLVIYNLYLLGAATFACAGCYTLERTRRIAFLQTFRIDRARRVNETLALHDNLTQLPNRQMFERRLKNVLEQVHKGNISSASVFFIDLDHFKPINDQYGHAVGDKVLKIISRRLSLCARPDYDLVARIGGDEFLVLTEGIHQDQVLRQFASKLIDEISKPITINLDQDTTMDCRVGASIGIAVINEGRKQSPASLIKQADMAMYQVKREGKNGYAFYKQQYAAITA